MRLGQVVSCVISYRLLCISFLTLCSTEAMAHTSPQEQQAQLHWSLQQQAKFGSPFHIGGDPVLGPASRDQVQSAMAFDGKNYLVVWQDDRSGAKDIFGARVTPSGVVLDPTGIAISIAPGEQITPDAAFDGKNFFVVWSDERSTVHGDIYGARVTPAGEVLDPDGVEISSGYNADRLPDIAFDGRNYFVVWTDWDGREWDIHGARVSTSGKPLDAEDIVVAKGSAYEYHAALAFDGTNYMVVWGDKRSGAWDIYGTRVNTAGDVMDANGAAISTMTGNEQYPVITFDGANYLVAWKGTRDETAGIYGARVSPFARVLDPEGMNIAIDGTGQLLPAAAFDGINHMVVWSDERLGFAAVRSCRVSPSGEILEPEGVPILTSKNSQQRPAIACGGSDYLVVWDDRQSGSLAPSVEIVGVRVSREAQALDSKGKVISTSGNTQTVPAVAFDGANYMVVWEDERTGGADIYGTHVSPSGLVPYPGTFAISNANGWQRNPDIASDGQDCLVVWEDGRDGSWDIYGSRVGSSGTVMDPGGIVISRAKGAQRNPSLVFNGTDYFVVWDDYRNGRYEGQIYASRVNRDGEVLDPQGMAIGGRYRNIIEPAISFDGDNYLLAFTVLAWESRVAAMRVSLDGEVLDPLGIRIPVRTQFSYHPFISFDGVNFLLAWEQYERDGDIHCARISTSGEALETETIPVVTTPEAQGGDAIAFDGENYILLWQDCRGSLPGIYYTWITPSGTVLEPDGMPMTDGTSHQYSPAVASGNDGQLLVAFSAFAAHLPYGATHVWANLWKPQPREEALLFLTKPNPFSTSVSVSYYLPTNGRVRLAIYDVTGRLVKTLANGEPGTGWHHHTWNGTDEEGRKLPSGVYFAAVESKYGRAVKKCVLVR